MSKIKLTKAEREEIFEYLDVIGELVTSLPKYVQRRFNMTWDDAKAVVELWRRARQKKTKKTKREMPLIREEITRMVDKNLKEREKL